MSNWNEKCLNTTDYPIFNMQNFRYWLCNSMLFCFGHMVSPLSIGNIYVYIQLKPLDKTVNIQQNISQNTKQYF